MGHQVRRGHVVFGKDVRGRRCDAVAKAVGDCLGHQGEDPVAGLMTLQVVHRLEAVEIQHQDRQRLGPGEVPEPNRAVLEGSAVGQTAERVGVGEVLVGVGLAGKRAR